MTGGYNRTRELGFVPVHVEALKCFQENGLTLWWIECYAADIGFVGGGNLWGSTLTYAYVGGVEYGEKRRTSNATEAAPPAPSFTLDAVYPNPVGAAASANVAYTLPRSAAVQVSVVNALGQTVRTAHLGTRLPGRHVYEMPSAGLAPGLYYVQMQAGPRRAVRAIVVHP